MATGPPNRSLKPTSLLAPGLQGGSAGSTSRRSIRDARFVSHLLLQAWCQCRATGTFWKKTLKCGPARSAA